MLGIKIILELEKLTALTPWLRERLSFLPEPHFVCSEPETVSGQFSLAQKGREFRALLVPS